MGLAGAMLQPTASTVQIAKNLILRPDVKRDYGASGSSSTTTGSINSGSKTLTLASAIDFKPGQGLSIAHAGSATSLSAPTSATATAEGTTGSTTIDYAVAALDADGGITASYSVSVADANATLSSTNYVALAVGAVVNAVAYAWWRKSTNGTSPTTIGLLAVTKGAALNDVGLGTISANWIPSSAPASALGQALITQIEDGAGTTTLTLSDAASSMVSTDQVMHDDTSVLQSAINKETVLYFPNGQYRTSSTLNMTSNGQVITADPINKINGNTAIFPTTLFFDVLEISAYYGGYIENLQIICNKAANKAVGIGGRAIFVNNAQSMTLKNIGVQSAYNGIYITGGGITLDSVSVSPADIPESYDGRYGFYVTGASGNANLTQATNCSVSQVGSTTPRTVDAWVLADGYSTLILVNCGSNQCYRALWSTNAGGSAPNFLQTYNFGADHNEHGVVLDDGNYALFNGLLVTSSYISSFQISSGYSGGPVQVDSSIIAATNGGIMIEGGDSIFVSNTNVQSIGGSAATSHGFYVSGGNHVMLSNVFPNNVAGDAFHFASTFSGEFEATNFQQHNANFGVNIESNTSGLIRMINGILEVDASYGFSFGSNLNPQNTFIQVIGITPRGGLAPPSSPLVSGTVYQNTYMVPIIIYQPAYATTSGTAGTVAVALGGSSPGTVFTQRINGSSTSSGPDVIQLRVAPGQYYSFTTTGATLANANFQGE